MTDKPTGADRPIRGESPLRCLAVIGPTATGKTRLAVALARRFGGEIVSADSRQVYRGLDIGTGKDLKEYGEGNDRVPYHLIDVAEPSEEYNLFRFVCDARDVLRKIAGRGRLPIIAGGTPLYVNALLDNYDLVGGEPDGALRRQLESLNDDELTAILAREAPAVFARTDRTQRRRLIRAVEIARSAAAGPACPPLELAPLILAPYYPRTRVHERIEARLDARLAQGLPEEVERLQRNGLSWERLDFLGLEYRYVALYLRGELTRDDMRNVLLARIRRFCKAQDVWFRKMEREGKQIHWIPGGDFRAAEGLVSRFLSGHAVPPPELSLATTLYGPRSAPLPPPAGGTGTHHRPPKKPCP